MTKTDQALSEAGRELARLRWQKASKASRKAQGRVLTEGRRRALKLRKAATAHPSDNKGQSNG